MAKKSLRTRKGLEKIRKIETGKEAEIVSVDTEIGIEINKATARGTSAVVETEIRSVLKGTEAMIENAAIGMTEGIERIEEIVVTETTGITIAIEMEGEAAVIGIGTTESTADDILAPEPGLEAEEIPVEKGALRV